MAKKSMIERQTKRLKTVQRYAAKRAEYRRIIRSPSSTDEERQTAQQKLQVVNKGTAAIQVKLAGYSVAVPAGEAAGPQPAPAPVPQ